jgi:hypothetical protein
LTRAIAPANRRSERRVSGSSERLRQPAPNSLRVTALRRAPSKGAISGVSRQVARDLFERSVSRRNKARPRQEREVGQRAAQAAVAGTSESNLRHLRALLLDRVGRDAYRAQRQAHGVRKCRPKSTRFTNRNQHRKTRRLADEQQRVKAIRVPRSAASPTSWETLRGVVARARSSPLASPTSGISEPLQSPHELLRSTIAALHRTALQ